MKLDIGNIFEGMTVYVIASGESLRGFDFSRLKNKITIVVNDVFRYVPNANVLVALDYEWQKRNKQLLINFNGIKLMQCGKGRLGWNYFIDTGEPEDLAVLRKTRNSGFYAMIAAIKLGAGKIYLLGFDIIWQEQPYFYDIPIEKVKEYKSSMHRKASHLQYFEYYKDFNIINASPNSAITCFKKCKLDEIWT